MNIFVLDKDPRVAARDQCDKHIVKMVLEYAQMLSSAHRVCDGKKVFIQDVLGKKHSVNLLEGEEVEMIFYEDTQKWKPSITKRKCYAVAHKNHPCTIWARFSKENYQWLFDIFDESCKEYTRRYHKTHKCERFKEFLSTPPQKLLYKKRFLSRPALAMPDQFKTDSVIESYRRLYIESKSRFAKWNFSPTPEWYKEGILHVSRAKENS